MKKSYLLGVLSFFASHVFAQLTVTTSPASATICNGNAVSITATATPISYTGTVIGNNPYDPTLFAGNILVDQLGFYTGGTPYTEPLSFGTLDDGRWDNIALPFSFRFYGNVFNTIHISTNGWVGLGSTNSLATGYGVALPNAAAPNNVIHAITTDLTFAGITNAAVLQYFTVGSAPNQRFVIDYSNIKFFSGTATANVQVILYEGTNVIEIHTSSCTNTAAAKAQGIENSTGTVATVATGKNNTANWAIPVGGSAFRFTPDVINYTWSPATGLNTTTGATVIASPTVNTTYTVNAVNASNGQTGNTTVAVTVDPASYILAAAAGGAQICQNIIVAPTGTNYRDGNCNLIAKLAPTGGGTALSNAVNTCVKVETASGTMGTSSLYLARHYDISPIVNAATATADVTLYFKQSEFDNYNTLAPGNNQKTLPTGPADATGISNLVLRQFHGTGTNPTNYTGASVDFTTATSGFTVTWNATRGWWEVVVPVNGFSGFYITSSPLVPLPVTLEYFKGNPQTDKNVLNWKVNCTSETVRFEVERSANGTNYSTIGSISATRLQCNQPFETADNTPAAGANYYRIKIIEQDGKSYYSNVVLLTAKSSGFSIVSISPNPAVNENAVLKINAGSKTTATIVIADMSGRVVRTQTAALVSGLNQLVVNTQPLAAGAYYITVQAPTANPATIRLVKQ